MPFLLLTGCFPDDDDINQGKVETTIRVVSLPGVSPYPDGTSLEVFVKEGPYNNRSYSFFDTVKVAPVQGSPHLLEGTLIYEGTLPTLVEIFPTENPQVTPPFEFTNPFDSQSVDFTLTTDGPYEFEMSFLPNYWMDIQVYTEKSETELGTNLIIVGDGRSSPTLGSMDLRDKDSINDTLGISLESNLHYGEVTGLYLYGSKSDNSDSVLFTLDYADLVAHDTTFIFYDMDKPELIITQ